MKKLLMIPVILLSLAILPSCVKNDDSVSSNSGQIQLSQNKVLKFTTSDEGEITVSAAESQTLVDFVQQRFEGHQNVDRVFNFTIETIAGKGYIIFNGFDKAKGKINKYAISISKTGNEQLYDAVVADSHSCEGNPCSCCGFLKNDKGEIYGCDCLKKDKTRPGCDTEMANKKCNHKIST